MADGGASISTALVATMSGSGISSSPATSPLASWAVAPQVRCHGRRKRKYTATPAAASIVAKAAYARLPSIAGPTSSWVPRLAAGSAQPVHECFGPFPGAGHGRIAAGALHRGSESGHDRRQFGDVPG